MKPILMISALVVACSCGCVHYNIHSCSVDIAGDWEYAYLPGMPTARSITFEQEGCTFSGVSPSYTLHGIIVGNEIRISQLVTGETMEGIVMRVEGSYHEGSLGDRRITGLFTRPNGETGSWVASEHWE